MTDLQRFFSFNLVAGDLDIELGSCKIMLKYHIDFCHPHSQKSLNLFFVPRKINIITHKYITNKVVQLRAIVNLRMSSFQIMSLEERVNQ